MQSIVISPYDPSWPAAFAALRADLARGLGPLATQVSHIGSTAVPGLAAKDIIDIQLGVHALSEDIVSRLAAQGYEWIARHQSDHVPPGEDPAPDEWRKLCFRRPSGVRPCHVHVRVCGRANHRYALLFRDYLRAHAPTRLTVERIKRELARLHADDADAYYAVKDPAYDLVWQAAKNWAQASHWTAAGSSEA